MRQDWWRLAAIVTLSAIATVPFAACGGSDDGRAGRESTTPVATQTQTIAGAPTLTPEEEVRNAYLHYWEVYGQALFALDQTRLAEVMTGPRLERALSEMEQLRANRQAVRIVVENNPLVVEVTGDKATVFDQYQNRSYVVDLNSKEPLNTPPAGQTIRDTVTMVKVGATWKVSDSIREAGQQ